MVTRYQPAQLKVIPKLDSKGFLNADLVDTKTSKLVDWYTHEVLDIPQSHINLEESANMNDRYYY
jgi:hypothetical protein